MIRSMTATLLACLALSAFATPPPDNPPAVRAEAQPSPALGMEGFAYPFLVRGFAFETQRQGLQMAYMDVAPTGKPNGRTVVLLHGKNFCAATWEAQMRSLLAAGYRVVAPDQIGFCKSSKPASYQYSLAQLAANTHALTQKLGLQRITLIGHSMGGMLAMRYALMYPQQLEKLVLVNPIGLEDWLAKGVPYKGIDAYYEKELKTSAESIKQYQLKTYYDGKWKPEYDRWVRMLADQYDDVDGKLTAWNQALTTDMLLTQPVIREIDRIRVPTLLMIGQRDNTAIGKDAAPPSVAKRLGNYSKLGREAARRIAGSELVSFDDLGHSPQVQDAARFDAELLKRL
jgi:pimeloyl-ACP methyl ester carboxylesterase